MFQDAQEASNTFNKGKETVLDFTNTEGTITLNEGNVLRVEYTPIIMTKGGGFTFDGCLLSERSTNENLMMKTLKSGLK